MLIICDGGRWWAVSGSPLAGSLTRSPVERGRLIRPPYVAEKVSKRTGKTQYTGMYCDRTETPRSAGTCEDEPEALTAARREQDKRKGRLLGDMTLPQRRAVTFEEFWPIFQRHHRVEPNTMQTYFGTWINHVHPYLKSDRVATFRFRPRHPVLHLADGGGADGEHAACLPVSVLSAMNGLSIQMGFRVDSASARTAVRKASASSSSSNSAYSP